MIRTGALATVVAAACVLTACSSGGNDGPGPSPSPSPSASSTSRSVSSSPISQPTNLPTSIANTVALRKAVQLTSCTAAAGGWQARGTARNDRGSAFTYALTVYFTNSSATVVGFAKKRVKVGAKKTATWSAVQKFDAPKNTQCVLVGVAKG